MAGDPAKRIVIGCRSQAVKEAAARARAGEGPSLIEMRCIRMTAHSSDDNDRTYRTKEEKEAERQHDPVAFYQHYLREQVLENTGQSHAVRIIHGYLPITALASSPPLAQTDAFERAPAAHPTAD